MQRAAVHGDGPARARLCRGDLSKKEEIGRYIGVPVVIGAGRFRTIFVVPAPTFTDCSPFEGATAVAAAPLMEIVPPTTQLGMRTL